METAPDDRYGTADIVSTYPEETLLQSIRTQQSGDKEIVNIISYLAREENIAYTDTKETQLTYCCNSKERILWNIVL